MRQGKRVATPTHMRANHAVSGVANAVSPLSPSPAAPPCTPHGLPLPLSPFLHQPVCGAYPAPLLLQQGGPLNGAGARGAPPSRTQRWHGHPVAAWVFCTAWPRRAHPAWPTLRGRASRVAAGHPPCRRHGLRGSRALRGAAASYQHVNCKKSQLQRAILKEICNLSVWFLHFRAASGSRALRGAVKPQTQPPTGWPGSGLAVEVILWLLFHFRLGFHVKIGRFVVS